MPTYKAEITPPVIITPDHHAFTLRLYIQVVLPDAIAWRAIGSTTFDKTPQETWAQAGARLHAHVQDWLARTEQRDAIEQAVSAWLATQTWTT